MGKTSTKKLLSLISKTKVVMNKKSIDSTRFQTRQETHEQHLLENQDKQHDLPIIPLKNVVLFPQSVIPLIIGRPRSIKAIEYAAANKTSICLVTQNDPSIEDPEEEDIFLTGTRANIIQVLPMAKGAVKVLVEGICRFSIQETTEQNGIWTANGYSFSYQDDQSSAEIHALWRRAKQVYKTYVNLHAQNQNNLSHNLQDFENIAVGADTLSAHNGLGFRDKQLLLEATSLKHQLMALIELLEREVEIVKIEERIRGRVQMQVEKNQREYYLNEQIKAINKELGRDDQEAEQDALLQKISKARLPEAVHAKIERELRRLEQMPSLSAEASVSRNYIDWILQLPWHKESKDRISLVQAERILDRDHYGLQKVKERILEFIAAKKFNPELSRSPIVCLVGPPGVGKTSLARSIAAALGREFARISLGGTRDESEIRGHRRTYVGAMPGKFIQALANLKTTNPVILLDEIDKMSQDIYGDPASALLEVLDPEQNKNFVDNYLEVAYNLSKTMFIATANSIDGIPYPLFDRMEVISLSSYTEEEKLHIARKFLIPKLLKEYNLPARQFKLSPTVLSFVISQYTKEAGVRQLERVLAKLIRKVIAELLTAKDHESQHNKVITITPALCRSWLGVPLFKRRGLAEQENLVGCATGLAWTELGGDILEIEATVVPGKGEVTLTGQLGDVMRESAHAALSYIKSVSQQLGIKKDFFSQHDIHVHVPEGATPKDGPSAGIALCCAVTSAITHAPFKPYIAMTGEITLRGRVLGVGGLKEKLIAAEQHEIKEVFVPAENKEEVEKLQEELSLGLTINFVDHVQSVLDAVLTQPQKASKKKRN